MSDDGSEEGGTPPRRQRRRYLYVFGGIVFVFVAGMSILTLLVAFLWSLAWSG